MNRKPLTKHDIYRKLIGCSEEDLQIIAVFIDSLREKRQLEGKKLLKLEGILKGYDIDFSELEQFRKRIWQHVEQESSDG
jgi:hypothetical protein